MSADKSIEDQIIDRLMEKLKSDGRISPDLVLHLEELRREGLLGQPEKLLEAYRREVTANGIN